jgi:glycosyltransferase involved in cell wall biosynthesis
MNANALILAPFAGDPQHVGNLRLERFVRWLSQRNISTTIVSANASLGLLGSQGEIVVPDPFVIYRAAQDRDISGQTPKPRKPSKFRRHFAQTILIPDLGVAWAYSVIKSKDVQRAAKQAALVVSTSPAESNHMAAWRIAKKNQIPHLMDMRDGWLDEPLRSQLNKPGVRRYIETKLEQAICHDASAIMVTSNTWKRLLQQRYPDAEKKIHVVTNTCPNKPFPEDTKIPRTNSRVTLIHAGQFTESRSTQRASKLFDDLYPELNGTGTNGDIVLYGKLTQQDRTDIDLNRERFTEIGWTITDRGHVPRTQLQHELESANGLLLLSATHAPLPSKLFEYLATGVPVFASTPRNSAVHELAALAPAITTPHDLHTRPFYAQKKPQHAPPSITTEEKQSESFIKALDSILSKRL